MNQLIFVFHSNYMKNSKFLRIYISYWYGILQSFLIISKVNLTLIVGPVKMRDKQQRKLLKII